MRFFKFCIITILTIFCSLNCIFGQNTTVLPFEAIYNASDNKVYLRWAPLVMDDWYDSLDEGFMLSRTRIMDSLGNNVSEATVELGLISKYTPSEWNVFNNTPLMELASAARSLVHQDSLEKYLTLPDSSQLRLFDAIEYTKAKNEFYSYALLIADQNFEIAKGLGLGYIDTTSLQSGHYYVYTITVNSSDSIASEGRKILQINPGSVISPPTKPSAEGKNLKAEITWSTEGLENQYVYYDIFRSDDNGVNFNKVNPYPFIKMTDVNLPDDTLTTYIDSIPQNDFTYVYKIQGISPFGIEAPFSDTVHVKGVPPLLNINVRLDTVQVTEAISMQWTIEKIFDDGPDHSAEIVGFNIYQRENHGDVGEMVNDTLLSSSLRSYTFSPSFPSAYYIVEALDQNDRSYISIALLGQAIDSIPPDAPENLSGEVGQNGTVSLQWDPNSETDLIGYKVFFSNSLEGDFAQITQDVVTDTSFTTFTDLSFGLDKIFYYVCAVDKRYNISEPSNIAILNRPDKVAPANPLLSHVLPREEGMRIAWKLSNSPDVMSHILQRKLKQSNTWQNIISISDDTQFPQLTQLSYEMVPSNYVDTAQLTMTYYQYRLIALDSSGNAASSDLITVKPYDDGIRGQILYLQGSFYDLNSPNSGILHPDLNIIPNLPNGNANFIDKDASILTWRYNTNFPSTHRDFKIYFRFVETQGGGGSGGAGSGSNSTLDTHGDIEDFKLIKTITAYDAHKMASAIQVNGFAFAHEIARKDTTTMDLEYKIIATHTDGGFSMPETIIIQTN